MTRRYIDAIKDRIKAEADKQASQGNVTLEFIESAFHGIAKKIRGLETEFWEVPSIDDVTLKAFFETAKREYLSLHPIRIEASSALTKPNFKTWLTKERETSTDWNYLDRYLQFLELQGRPENVIRETKRSSADIVGKLGDPASASEFFVKGLVVGEVQSGKTSNFNAVINRAIDSGYQLIIVLSGIMEDLREQTQDRVESEVVGWGMMPDTDQNGKKGVGAQLHFGMQGDASVQLIESITSCSTDFSGALLKGGAALNSPKLLVCKKNVSVLKNIINWLADILQDENDYHSVPLLILDDEADNASLNNEGAKGREYASKINGHIRAILALFHKKSYLGYTATPFANVLQDRNDPAEARWPIKSSNGERTFRQVDNLFPDDFIVLLESPSNYVGAKQIFETVSDRSKLPVVTEASDFVSEFPTRLRKNDGSPIDDFPARDDWDEKVGKNGSFQEFSKFSEYKTATRASRRDDGFPRSLPRSLKDAVLCFIIAVAVRESRRSVQSGSNLFEPHNSMLIHISRFTTWQNKTQELVKEYVAAINSRVLNDKPSEEGSIYFELEEVWNRHFLDIINNIRSYLPDGYIDDFMAPIAFEAVRKYLPGAVEGIDVLAVNSATSHRLEYSSKQPRKIIAIGGNRLSRGFTVRGLTVNYFIRSTNYSDTLLQMGRWFGYRPGYLDCCSIFTTRDSIEKFNSTTRCVEELEAEFKKMRDQGKSPRQFLLRVRKHPGVLKITRPSILKGVVTVKWSYQDQLEMTTKFNVSKENISQVWESFKEHVAPKFSGAAQDDFLTFSLKGESFIQFLRRPNNFEPSTLDTMIKFIELCQEENKLTDWTIALKRKGRSKRTLTKQESGLSFDTGLAIRNGPKVGSPLRGQFFEDKIFRASGRSANIVSSPLDLAITLSDHEKREAERNFLDLRFRALIKNGMTPEEAKKNLPSTIPERVYRERIPENQGVLIVYLCDSHHSFNQVNSQDREFDEFVDREGYDLGIPLVGYAIGFPPIENDPGGEYVHGDYDLEVDEGGQGDVNDDDLSVPTDEGFAVQ